MEKRSAPLPSRRIRARPGPATAKQVEASLDDVRRIIGVGVKPVAKVLPEAIAQATEERSSALSAALEPAVTKAIRNVASRESDWFGEILAPAIGAAVRKAVATAFAALMQRFNEALERSLSIRSFQWRFEARRTGRPFAEVVLLHTLVYRVEQVFLIHANTGLVLQHVVAEGAPAADPDQVASMLSAIDSFGREAFEPKSAAGVYLHEFALGDLTVWIDKAGAIAIAVVVRGMAPRSLLELVGETRERIILEHRAALARFVSDVEPFAATRPLLERCLREQRLRARRRGPVILAVAGIIITAAIATLLVRGHSRSVAEQRHLAAYRHTLEARPGIVVTSAGRRDGRYRFTGLRDPIAETPAELLARLGFPPADLSFQPFYSLDPRVIEKRFRRAAQPPTGVMVKVTDGTLHVSGEAPHGWVERALPIAAALPGIERVDEWVSDATVAELGSASRALEATEVRFDPRSSRITEAFPPIIDQAVHLIDRVRASAADLHYGKCVMIIGDADPTGPARLNGLLGAERASSVRGAIREKNSSITDDMIRARGRNAFDVGPRTRSAHFHVQTGADSYGTDCRHGEAP